MSVPRYRGPAARVLTSFVCEACPHCGALVDLVTLLDVARVRCDAEVPMEFADGTLHFVRMIHLCEDRGARRRALRDLVTQIPRR